MPYKGFKKKPNSGNREGKGGKEFAIPNTWRRERVGISPKKRPCLLRFRDKSIESRTRKSKQRLVKMFEECLMKKETVVIIGSGPAGCTAAIYTARANLNPLVIAGTLPGGLLTQTSRVENFPGFPDGVSGFDLVMGMQRQAERFGARIEYDEVQELSLTDGGIQTVHLSSGETIDAEAIILATGATPRHLGIPSEEQFQNRGVSTCATCDGAFYQNVPVSVLGGGDSAMEEALFLTRFASKVYVVHRREEFRSSRIMVERAMNERKIELLRPFVVDEILGETKVEGLRVRNISTGERSVIDCKAVFVALGHVPNTALFRQFINTDEAGYAIRKEGSSKTDLGGVFVAGDCADHEYRQAIIASGMGCQAAIDAERYLKRRHESTVVNGNRDSSQKHVSFSKH